VIIRFAFTGVEEVRVEDFNFQNVINSLVIQPAAEEAGRRVGLKSSPSAWLRRCMVLRAAPGLQAYPALYREA
jgi:hypothetical protein